MEKDFSLLLARDQAMIEEYLSGLFRTEARYADLQEAMEYSLLSGGKRLRPVLVLETCRMCGGILVASEKSTNQIRGKICITAIAMRITHSTNLPKEKGFFSLNCFCMFSTSLRLFCKYLISYNCCQQTQNNEHYTDGITISVFKCLKCLLI